MEKETLVPLAVAAGMVVGITGLCYLAAKAHNRYYAIRPSSTPEEEVEIIDEKISNLDKAGSFLQRVKDSIDDLTEKLR